MKIACIGDVHYGEDSNFAEGGSDYINTFGSKFPDFYTELYSSLLQYNVVATLGDSIADKNHKDDFLHYTKFLSFFNVLPMPSIHVCGNHDGENLSIDERAAFMRRYKTNYVENLFGFHHVVLDCDWSSYPYAVGRKQIRWLKKDLKSILWPTIVYMHCPCDEQDVSDNYYFRDLPERLFVKEKKKLRGIFEKSGKVRMVISGHAHFFHQEEINGITYVTVPSLTENDGTGKPCGKYVGIDIQDDSIFVTVESLK